MNAAHLCLARHGETDWNKSGILQGWTDMPLNMLGREQAGQMAAAYAAAGFTAVWTSPLVRASATAEIIAQALGLAPPSHHAGLRERHFGAIQGIPKSELAVLNPSQLEQILRRNPAAQFTGGESMDEFADRVLAACSDIGAHHRRDKVLVVTHGWVLDVLARHIAGLPRSAVLKIKTKNGESLWLEATEHALGPTRV